MRNIYFLIVCILVLAACKKSADAPTAYSFTKNGSQFSGNNYTASYKTDSTGRLTFKGFLYIGAESDNKYVSLTFTGNNYIDTSTHTNVGALHYFDGNYNYNEQSGSYAITKLDTVNHLISGTFQFTATSPIETIVYENVSNGIFTDLNYTAQ